MKYEIIDVLTTIKKDAKGAINGTWDKSDEGFQAQIDIIDSLIRQLQPGGKDVQTDAEEIIDMVWSVYCDLTYWIDDMDRESQHIPKNVLKMAMKHIKTEMKKVHDIACKIKNRR